MAEVTGNIGGQPVELNNAATEATLQQLVKGIGLLVAASSKGGGGGGGSKNQAQIEKELKKYYDQLRKLTPEQKKQLKSVKTQTDATDKNIAATIKESDAKAKATDAAERTTKGAILLTKGLHSAAQELVSIVSDVANLGNSMTSAAGLFNHIPVIGGIMSQTFGAIASAATNLLNSFQAAAGVGANFGGSLQEFTQAATDSGMTVTDFGNLVKSQGENIALLGQGTADGARNFARMNKDMRQLNGGQTFNSLTALGYSTADINQNLATYGAMMQRTGQLQNMTTQQVAAGAANYMKELDALARLTGKSKEALQAEEEQRMLNAQYQSFMRGLDATTAAQVRQTISALPQDMQRGAIESLVGVVGDAGADLQAYMPGLGQALTNMGQHVQNGGRLVEGTSGQIVGAMQAEARALADSDLGRTLAQTGTDAQQAFMIGTYQIANRQTDLAAVQAQQAEEERRRAEARASQQQTDISNMVRFQEQIAGTSNRMQALLAENLPALTTAFTAITDMINTVLLPVFNNALMPAITWLSENLTLVTTAIVGVGGAMKAWNFFQQTRGTRLNPMIVEDRFGGQRGGGGGGGRGGRGGRGGGGAGGAAGRTAGRAAGGVGRGLLRRLPLIGAIAGLGFMASDVMAAENAAESGEISREEARREQGGAIGEGGGALAGAAAGAAIGSVVPIVGTAIGGIIGGVLGGWLGRQGGEAIADATAENMPNTAPGSPTTPAPVTRTLPLNNYQNPVDEFPSGADGQQLSDSERQRQQEELLRQQQGNTEELMRQELAPQQENLGRLLSELNTSTSEMVALMRTHLRVAERQLSATANGNDIFAG